MKKFILLILLLTGLTFGMSAQDKLKEMRSNVIEKKDGREYYIHTVKRGQTLYMISKAYDVEVSDIIRENPEVKEGIRSDQRLKIPRKGTSEPVKKETKTIPEEKVVTKPPVPPPPEPPKEDTTACEELIGHERKTWTVALMMPLYLNEVELIDIDKLSKSGIRNQNSLQFIQFYEGFALALDSLKQTKINLKVKVYDITKDTVRLRKLLRDPEFKKTDLIIGLLFNKPFQLVEEFAQVNSIPLVNPVSERDQIVNGNPQVIKVQPTLKSQIRHLSAYLKHRYPGENVLIIKNEQYPSKEDAEELKRECHQLGVDSKIMDGYVSTLAEFSKEKENVVVAFSDNRSYVLDLVTKLNEWRNEYRITLIGLPRWDKMDNIEVDYLVNLKTHLVSSQFIDYENPEIRNFVRKFMGKYFTDPQSLAFLGYDIAFYFVSAMNRYGKSFERCLPGYRMNLLQNDFHFTSAKGNGYVNQNWEIYRYEDYFLRGSDLE